MTLPNIALIGRARSGKDSVAACLGLTHQYVPLAFATPLKTAAEKLNPIVSGAGNLREVRLNDVLEEMGWEGAKDAYPEVRRILQHMGQGVRDLDPDFWVVQLQRRVREVTRHGGRVVVTDVRYPNEARMLELEGFATVRVIRPTSRWAQPNPNAEHVSETALDHFMTDYQLMNNGTIPDLRRSVAHMVTVLPQYV